MTLLSFENLSVSFGAREVLRGISGRIERGQRIGLVGPNGAGKTTLLRALLGKELDMVGQIHKAKDIHLAYLGQETEYTDDTVLTYVTSAGINSVELAQAMLRQVGIYDCMFSRPIAHLSGGQRTRVSLAKVLVGSPDVLLLDANKLRQHALAQRDQLLQVIRNQRERYRIAHAQAEQADKGERPYRKARAKKHARQIKARLNQLERLETQIPEKSIAPVRPTITFATHEIGSDNLLHIDRLSFGYSSDYPVLHSISLAIKPRERIGLLGNNGTGKTTLLRLILQELKPQSGTVRYSPSIKMGYLPQDLRDIPLSLSAATWLSVRMGHSDLTSRKLLGRMNLTQDEALKPLGQLSMGQRYRALIAALLAQEVGLLVLDEPTNYLDMWARESVEEALRAFSGAIILVSHDRYFLESLTNKLWVIENGTAVAFSGKISAYQEWRRLENNPDRKARHLERVKFKEQEMIFEMRLARLAAQLQRSTAGTLEWESYDKLYSLTAEQLNEIKVRIASSK